MIRKHPEALAIGVILFFLPIGSFFRSLNDEIRREIAPLHRELRLQRDNFRLELRDEIRQALRFDCISAGSQSRTPFIRVHPRPSAAKDSFQ
jgi:hypothetical protein